MVKQYSGLLAPFIALLFNASLSTWCFPAKFKHAIVTPLEKKGTPRQQSTEKLPSGSKFTVPIQVIGESHSEPASYNIISPVTTPCGPCRSSNLHTDNFTVPRRLLSRFSTTSCWRRSVDHTLLLTRLQRSFGFQGGCLAWFTSYRNCSWSSTVSPLIPCHVFGPTGLGSWPVYMADLADIADNQLHIHCKPENVQSAVTSLQ